MKSTQRTDSAPFITFMLQMVLETVTGAAPQVTPQVPPQVGELLLAIHGVMSREQLQSALRLLDRKSFAERYLKPEIAEGLIEMTVPEKPNNITLLLRDVIVQHSVPCLDSKDSLTFHPCWIRCLYQRRLLVKEVCLP